MTDEQQDPKKDPYDAEKVVKNLDAINRTLKAHEFPNDVDMAVALLVEGTRRCVNLLGPHYMGWCARLFVDMWRIAESSAVMGMLNAAITETVLKKATEGEKTH